eukprot:2056934-Pyramimonas_sp.AAC.1
MKDPTDRKRFLQSFASAKEKTLDWLTTFEENCTGEEVHTKSAKMGVPERVAGAGSQEPPHHRF